MLPWRQELLWMFPFCVQVLPSAGHLLYVQLSLQVWPVFSRVHRSGPLCHGQHPGHLSS